MIKITDLSSLPDREPLKVEYKPLCEGVTREDVIKELNKSDYPKQSLQKIAKCRQSYYLRQCGSCGTLDVTGTRCESKICPECGQKRIDKIIAQEKPTLDRLSKNPHAKIRPAHLVLTIKNVPDSEYNREYYQWVTHCMSTFYNNPYVKSRILGGIYSIETKRPLEDYVRHKKDGTSHKIAPGRTWNVHIHILVEASYISVKAISKIWKHVTGGSGVVYIKSKYADTTGALYEVLKYVLKPPNLGDARSYVRYLTVTKSLRLFNTWGTFRGHFQVSKKVPIEYHKKCPNCSSRLVYLFEIGLKEALRYQQLVKGPPKDMFGRFNDMGFPETFNRLKRFDPFFTKDKAKSGGMV